MDYLPEIIIAAVLFIILTAYTINSLPYYKKSKIGLLAEYRRIRVWSLKLQDDLRKHIISHDVLRQEITPGITYNEFLKQLQKNHALHLSEKKYLKLRTTNNRILLKKVRRDLKNQEEKLSEVQNRLTAIKQQTPHQQGVLL